MKKGIILSFVLLLGIISVLTGCGKKAVPTNGSVSSSEGSSESISSSDIISDSSESIPESKPVESSSSQVNIASKESSSSAAPITPSKPEPAQSSSAPPAESSSSQSSTPPAPSVPEYSIVGTWAREYVGDYGTSYTYYKFNRDGTYEKYMGWSIQSTNLIETGKYYYSNNLIDLYNIVYTDFGASLGGSGSNPPSWNGLPCEVYESIMYLANNPLIRIL